jgi:branched-chain amino acid transport system ATP-binding protein
LLDVVELSVRYGAVAALRDVSITIQPGEFIAIVGPNGAGKTTLLKSLMGLLRPAGGDIRLDGRSLLRQPPERIVRCGLSLVPEGRHVFLSLTVDENLLLGRLPTAGRRTITEDLHRVYDHFPQLERLSSRRASTLSGGEQQLLAVARGMLAEPRLLLLDEPSLGLAPQVVDVVLQSVVRLHQEGTAIVLVEQNARRAVALADRVYVLQKGTVVTVAAGKELTSDDMISAFLGGTRAQSPSTQHPFKAIS